MAEYARLPAVLEQLSEQGHALIQALIYAAMLVQVMILIMAEGCAMSALQPADGAAMVHFQAGLLHAAVQLNPKRGLAAQELPVLDIVREVQQTLKLQSREATHAVGAAMVDFQAGLLHAAVQLDPKRGLAAQELLVL